MYRHKHINLRRVIFHRSQNLHDDRASGVQLTRYPEVCVGGHSSVDFKCVDNIFKGSKSNIFPKECFSVEMKSEVTFLGQH